MGEQGKFQAGPRKDFHGPLTEKAIAKTDRVPSAPATIAAKTAVRTRWLHRRNSHSVFSNMRGPFQAG